MATKLRALVFLILFACAPAFAQTAVTGTITDLSGVPYSGATVAIQSTTNPSNSIVATCNGAGTFAASVQPGTYNITVNMNPGIAPPLGQGSRVYTVTGVVIVGASQSLSATLSATAPALTTLPTGGSIPQVTVNPVCPGSGASLSLNIITSQLLLCNNGVLSTATGYPGTVTDPTLFGVRADGQAVYDASWTNGANPVAVTISGTDAPFTASMTGKTCFGITANANTCPVGVFTFTDATHGTCSGTATGTATSNGTFVVGTDDGVAWQAAATALNARPACGTFVMPMGMSLTSKGFLNSQPARCRASTPSYAGETAGWNIVGQGINTTIIVPMPNFDFTTTSTQGMFFSDPSGAAGVRMQGFSIDFMGYNFSGINASPANTVLTLGSDSFAQDVGILDGLGAVTGTMHAFVISGQGDYGINLQVDAAAKTDGFDVTAPNATLMNSFVGDDIVNSQNGVSVTGTAILTSINNRYDPASTFGTGIAVASGGILYSYSDWSGINCTNTCVYIRVSGTGKAYFNNFQGNPITPVASANGLTFDSGGGGIVSLQNSRILGGSTNGAVNASAAGTIIDLGNNSYSGPFVNAGNLTYIGSEKFGSTGVTAAKLVLSAGWGSTAANTALSGGNAPIQFTITNSGTGQAASPTITYTFPTAYPVSPISCTATQIGGTNATGTFTSSSLSATGVTFTFSLTPTASSTEIVQVACVNP